MKENEKAGKPEQKKRKDDRWLDLEIWKIADALALQVFKETQAFPQCELYGLTSQLRRAVLSIPTNIVEGCSRKGDRELARFISISLGSLGEVKYLLYFSHQIGYLNKKSYDELSDVAKRLGAKLWRFYEKVRETNP
jgi:four helix bundle protein